MTHPPDYQRNNRKNSANLTACLRLRGRSRLHCSHLRPADDGLAIPTDSGIFITNGKKCHSRSTQTVEPYQSPPTLGIPKSYLSPKCLFGLGYYLGRAWVGLG